MLASSTALLPRPPPPTHPPPLRPLPLRQLYAQMARPAASQAPSPLPFSRPQRAQVLRTPLPPARPHCRPPAAPPSRRDRRKWPRVHRLCGPSSHGPSSGAESTRRPVHPVTIGRGGHQQLYRGEISLHISRYRLFLWVTDYFVQILYPVCIFTLSSSHHHLSLLLLSLLLLPNKKFHRCSHVA